MFNDGRIAGRPSFPMMARRVSQSSRYLSEMYSVIVALAEMEPHELQELSKKVGKNPLAFARYSESRRSLSSDLSDKPTPQVTEQPAIKTMPIYDPDAEVAGLTLTIPSWISSIDRAKNVACLEMISPAARKNLREALLLLNTKVQDMLTAIEEES